MRRLAMCVKSLQLYVILCNSTDCSPPGSSVHGILQARILEWGAISFSKGSSPRGLHLPGIEVSSPTLQNYSLPSEPPGEYSKQPDSNLSASLGRHFKTKHNHGFHHYPGGAKDKELAFQCRRHKGGRINPWVGKIP